MILDSMILSFFHDEAVHSVIDEIHFGLAYTAVTLVDGRYGLCQTYRGQGGGSCTVYKDPTDYEKKNSLLLLKQIQQADTLSRSLAIALANAFNNDFASACPPDMGTLARDLGLKEGDTLAMIGHFEPIVRQMKQLGIHTLSYDIGKQIGEEAEFYEVMHKTAKAVILTATSVINRSIETVAKRIGTRTLPTVLMGPSTIMRPELYSHLGLSILAGSAPHDKSGVLKVIRNGKGTKDLLTHARKVHIFLP